MGMAMPRGEGPIVGPHGAGPHVSGPHPIPPAKLLLLVGPQSPVG